MADITARDAKLIQYLNEAYGKEKQLEADLRAHIAMTEGKKTYRKRLQEHLKETKAHSRNLEQRIKKLGGKVEVAGLPGPDVASDAAAAVATVAGKAKALARGPLHTLRGTSLQEKLLKNAETEFSEEHHEIAMYTAIETLAETVGDKDTAKLARDHLRQEERMAKFLAGLIPQLTKDVAKAEIPASERDGGSTRRGSSARRSSSTSRGRSGRASRPVGLEQRLAVGQRALERVAVLVERFQVVQRSPQVGVQLLGAVQLAGLP